MYRDNQLKTNSSHEFFIFAKRTFEPSSNAQHANIKQVIPMSNRLFSVFSGASATSDATIGMLRITLLGNAMNLHETKLHLNTTATTLKIQVTTVDVQGEILQTSYISIVPDGKPYHLRHVK